MEKIKKKRHFIFLKILAALLIFALLGFYAYSFPKTMELLDEKINEIINVAGGNYDISPFSDFSVFAKKVFNSAIYYYEIIKSNFNGAFPETAPLPVMIFSCAAEFPLESGRITSGFGKRADPISKKEDSHSGLDIAAEFGSDVTAAWPGKIFETGFDKIYGKYIIIEHSEGFFTKYCHLSKICVGEENFVFAGEKIGEAGSTGRSTGNHLHFEVEINGIKFDPMECFVF